MILDSHLTYDNHIPQFVSSCLAKLVQINWVKNIVNKETLSIMITTLVFSKIFYCSSVSNLQKFQSIQNFVSKIITGSRKFDHVNPLQCQLYWLPVKQQLYLWDAVMPFKCSYNLAPGYLCSNLLQRTNSHDRLTSNRSNPEIPLFKTASGQWSFAYKAVKIWIYLDDSFKLQPSISALKSAMMGTSLMWTHGSVLFMGHQIAPNTTVQFI